MTIRRQIHMLKKLLGRHRTVQIGVTLLGASALAVGFASPAFAAQSVNNGNADNANAQNYFVVQGGSQAAYGAMVAEADLFNSAPGCDLVGINGTTAATAQPLDYGCPGLGTESGTTEAGTQSRSASVATYTVDVSAAGLKNLTLQSGSVPFTTSHPVTRSPTAVASSPRRPAHQGEIERRHQAAVQDHGRRHVGHIHGRLQPPAGSERLLAVGSTEPLQRRGCPRAVLRREQRRR